MTRTISRTAPDSHLIQAVQHGSNIAFETLSASFQTWVHHQGRHWQNLAGFDADDVAQTAWIGLWEAAQQFRPGGHRAFVPFALTVMRRRITDLAKTAYRGKHRLLSDALPWDAPTDEADASWMADGASNPEQLWVDQDGATDRIVRVMQQLSPLELRIFRCLTAGMETRDAVKHLGIGYRTYDNGRRRVIEKARALYVEAEDERTAWGLFVAQ